VGHWEVTKRLGGDLCGGNKNKMGIHRDQNGLDKGAIG
jgi:hypothetical protein